MTKDKFEKAVAIQQDIEVLESYDKTVEDRVRQLGIQNGRGMDTVQVLCDKLQVVINMTIHDEVNKLKQKLQTEFDAL